MVIPIRPFQLGMGWLESIRFPFPPRRAWPLLLAIALCNQPLGPSITVVLFALYTLVLAMLYPLPAKAAGNSLAAIAVFFVILIANSVFIRESLNLFIFYAFYASLCIVFFTIMNRVVSSLSEDDRSKTIQLLLLMDLLMNVPAVMLQLGLHGVGDYVSGLSGIFNQGSLSQGRTNAVRAGLIMVLALVRYSRKRDALSIISAAANMAILVTALSMTSILSAFGAGIVALIAGKKQSYWILKMALILGVAVLGGIFNQLKYGVSYADYLLALDYHYQITPKLNIYKFVIEDLIPDRPWTFFFGNGMGNLMNRFAILFNFENYASFPFKPQLQEIFSSPETRLHMINKYYLEKGVVGNSIISVPWSSGLAVFLETGILGCTLLIFSLRKFIVGIYGAGKGVVGSGIFFLAFFGFNLLFDVYLDYPEVVCAFVVIGLLLGTMKESPNAAR